MDWNITHASQKVTGQCFTQSVFVVECHQHSPHPPAALFFHLPSVSFCPKKEMARPIRILFSFAHKCFISPALLKNIFKECSILDQQHFVLALGRHCLVAAVISREKPVVDRSVLHLKVMHVFPSLAVFSFLLLSVLCF